MKADKHTYIHGVRETEKISDKQTSYTRSFRGQAVRERKRERHTLHTDKTDNRRRFSE